MTAGLPKSVKKLALLIAILAVISLFSSCLFGEELQTASSTLEDVITRLTEIPILSPEEQTLLASTITTAVEGGAITPQGVNTFLDLIDWEGLTKSPQAMFVTHALDIILNLMIDGTIGFEKAYAYLSDTINTGTLRNLEPLIAEHTQSGIRIAISNLAQSNGYDTAAIEGILEKVDALIAGDVPPGITFQVVKDLLRAGLDPQEIIAQLAALKTSIEEEIPPSKADDKVTNQENNKNQEPKESQNTTKDKNETPKKDQSQNSTPQCNENGKGDKSNPKGEGK